MAKKRKSTSRGMAEARAYFIGMAQQRLSDTKRQLFDDYDYDRISRAEYERKLKEAEEYYHSEVEHYKKM